MNLWRLVRKRKKPPALFLLPPPPSGWSKNGGRGHKELKGLGKATATSHSVRRIRQARKNSRDSERNTHLFMFSLAVKIKASTLPWDRWHRRAVTFVFSDTQLGHSRSACVGPFAQVNHLAGRTRSGFSHTERRFKSDLDWHSDGPGKYMCVLFYFLESQFPLISHTFISTLL